MSVEQIMPDGLPCQLIELTNSKGMKATVMDWGATWISCKIPLKNGELREVLLGCRNPKDYTKQEAYLGAIVGRYANRIANAYIEKNGQHYQLDANQNEHQLHGGPEGFNQRRWEVVRQEQNRVALSLCSEDGDQGYPGTLRTTVEYVLGDDNRLQIDYVAIVDKKCPVNLTNHAYFNLDAGGDARKQRIWVDANLYLPVDKSGIPEGELRSVVEGDMDLRRGMPLLVDFMDAKDRQIMGGYDHSYLLNARVDPKKFAALQLWAADNQLMMNLYTNKPALHVYTGNFLAGAPGRKGGFLRNFGGIALESQFLPDSPNHPEWPQPDCWLKPNQIYRYFSAYQFIAL